jgi:hypothetical protein
VSYFGSKPAFSTPAGAGNEISMSQAISLLSGP